MKALCWQGVNELSVEQVPDPRTPQRPGRHRQGQPSSTCGSDLHLLGGYIPTMRAGRRARPRVPRRGRRDRARGAQAPGRRPGGGLLVHRLRPLLVLPARAVLPVRQRQPQPGVAETLWGHAPGGLLRLLPRHGRLRRQPRRVRPGARTPTTARSRPGRGRRRSARCSPPTRRPPAGWARTWARCGPATWWRSGAAAAVGQMAARAAMLLGAERVIAIDRFHERLRHGRAHIGARRSTTRRPTSSAELRERTGGRGPDVCIEAVGHGGAQHRRRSTPTTRSSSSCGCRPTGRPRCARRSTPAARAAASSCSGVFAGLVDKFPLGRADEQGPDAARRPAARPPLHPDAAGADGARRARRRAPGHPRRCRWTRLPGATSCSRTSRTAASGRCSALDCRYLCGIVR